jgi:N-acetylglucosaminyl-diphospho-decaprenol L-rhamnosyltransferase
VYISKKPRSNGAFFIFSKTLYNRIVDLPNNQPEQNLDCSIVIVSYNTKDITDTCLTKAELASQHSHEILGNKTKIIVVDNASSDGTVDMIQTQHPTVDLVALSENLRFAKGNNIGLKRTQTPFILILNSDAYLEKETLVKILQYVQTHPDCDVLTCQLNFADGKLQTVGGYLPTPLRTIIWALGIDSLPLIKNVIHPIYMHTPSAYKTDRELEWCSGAFMLLKDEVYKKTGGFDENIYFYMEDVEFCRQIQDAGYKIIFTPDIAVTHLGGESSKAIKTKEKLQRNINGMMYFMSKYYPRSLKFMKAALTIGMGLRMLFYGIMGDKEGAAIYYELFQFVVSKL